MKAVDRGSRCLTILFFHSLLFGAAAAYAGVADHLTRTRVVDVDVITYPMGAESMVTIMGSLPAGDFFAQQDGSNPAIATLTGMMLERGTTHRDKFAISKDLDDVGATLSFDVDTQTVTFRGRSLKKDVPRLIQILGEELREPAFSSEEFAKAKMQFDGKMRAAMDDTNYRAREAFELSVFPVGHPNRPTSLEQQQADAERATLEEIKAFHAKHYGSAYLTLIFVGDVEADTIHSTVAHAFSGWNGGTNVARSVAKEQVRKAADGRITIPGKASVSVVVGQRTGLRYGDPDTLALRIGTAILGSGFTGRLMSRVRDKEGLTYNIRAGISDDEFVDGSWMINASFAPALLTRGVASTRREVQQWWERGVTADELAFRKSNLIGAYRVGLSTTAGMAGAILTIVERGKPLSWLDEMPEAVNALTVEQVNAAIKKHLDPKRMALIEAGAFQDAQPASKRSSG
jgi:zinc protease